MRRTFAAAAVSLALAVPATATTASAAPASPGPTTDPAGAASRAVPAREITPTQALEQAGEALEGTSADPEATDATLALRDLFVALPRLTGSDREEAEGLLARPTDRAADPYGDGYTTRSRKTCATRLCVHYVSSTRDAPPSRRWARITLRAMQDVWSAEIGGLGYRTPVRDGRRGGDDRFDVYLKELGSQGLYGYCAPERTVKGNRRIASGYCVLDDDFARSQFGRKPSRTLQVTAAHEFFHAIQFAYDYREDRWLMENTATWMEERVADGVNDNRQYLPAGQHGAPDQPLDTFNQFGANQYGNWVFFEYLSQRFGTGLVQKIWQQAGHARRDGGAYSTEAVKRVLPRSMRFSTLYLQYALALATPGESFREGDAWGRSRMMNDAVSQQFGRNSTVDNSRPINHMSTKPYRFRPADNLAERGWRMQVAVDGPARETGPVAGVVRVTPGGAVRRAQIRLDGEGRGSVRVPFNQKQTAALYVVLGNASIRFNCRRGTSYTCQGAPLDDGRAYGLTLSVSRRG